jgi:hypothetical protein
MNHTQAMIWNGVTVRTMNLCVENAIQQILQAVGENFCNHVRTTDKMSRYEIEFSKKDNGWVPKKETPKYDYRRVPNSPSFTTIEEAEKWVNENHKQKDRFDTPWIDHRIGHSRGNLIPLDEWKECCEDGGFIDYDGYGSAVDENYKIIEIADGMDYEGNHIWPSDYTVLGGAKIPIETKYILWYNR